MFDTLLDEVCEVCEIRKSLLVAGSRLQAVVDARVLLVQYLRRIGLTSDDIALFVLRRKSGDPDLCPALPELKKKSKNIDKLFGMYSARCLESYAFCLMSVEIKAFCEDKYKEYYLSWMKAPPQR